MDYTIAYTKSPFTDRLVAINKSGNQYYLSFSDTSEHVGGCSGHFRSFDAAIERYMVLSEYIVRHYYSSKQLTEMVRAEGEEI